VVRFFEFIRAFGCERDRSAAANLLTRDEARRIDAANIVKLPELPPAVVWVSCSGKFQTQPLTFATDGRAQIRGNDKRSTTAGSARPNCAYGYRNYALISSSVKPPSFVQIAGYCARHDYVARHCQLCGFPNGEQRANSSVCALSLIVQI
jgi:hypothetical protein